MAPKRQSSKTSKSSKVDSAGKSTAPTPVKNIVKIVLQNDRIIERPMPPAYLDTAKV